MCDGWDVKVGDASASQSPLSFGGFGSMLRHLQRLTDSLDQALKQDRLSRSALKLLQVPSLCVCTYEGRCCYP